MFNRLKYMNIFYQLGGPGAVPMLPKPGKRSSGGAGGSRPNSQNISLVPGPSQQGRPGKAPKGRKK